MKGGHRLMWIAENVRAPGFQIPEFNRFIYHLPPRTVDRAVAGRTVDWYQNSLNHPAYDEFWQKLSTRDKLDRVKIPVFAMGGWFDNYGQSDLEAFAELRRMGRAAYVVIGPWAHSFSEKLAVDFGRDSQLPVRRMQLEWFDHWLKGKDTIANMSPVRVFTMGENKWHEFPCWPPPSETILTLFLGGKKANSKFGGGTLDVRQDRRGSKDEYLYDPRKPVQTRGGAVCCNVRVLPPGPMDQGPVEQRSDVLVYTSTPLYEAVEVTGVIRALLYVSTSAPDTDFTAKLVDVAPDGSTMNLTDGILRLRFRRGLSRPQLAQPGKIYPVAIDAGVTSAVFRSGHRIRLEVASSNFPRFDRNPNTGRPVADEAELRVARQTVYRGGKYPSMVILPVVRRR
jgi:putative CocE/NonD family hydrolase